ncbi:MAG: PAS domain S-box protein, partial [Prolixibacteraceae bacterium]|nr:PAS domain S-box protein [Prolixibacteraceae bacterium]
MESEIRSNILVVDDRSENLFLIEATLDNLDVNLIMAESGSEALS